MKKSIKIIALLLIAVAMVFSVNMAAGYTPQSAYAAVIKQGSKGETVKTIQQKLKNWGYYTGAVDGIFGAKTTAAVKSFQKKNKLTVDGIVGAKTLAALGIKSTSSGATSSYSDSDVNLLAHLIYGEARGESYVGQVAVGAVVMNRIKSSSFPIASSTVYQTFASLMPGFKDKGNWAVYELHADISVILIKMLIYFAVATILAVVLIRRKDEE